MKKIFGILVLVVIFVAAGIYFIVQQGHISLRPSNFNDSILMRSTMFVMGGQTVTTVFKDGRTVVASDFQDQNVEFTLPKDKLDEVAQLLSDSGSRSLKFKPEPGVVYDGSMVLEVNVEKYVKHTTTNEPLERALQIVYKTRQETLQELGDDI